MEKKIVVLDANKIQCHGLCAMLDKLQYSTISTHSLPNLEKVVQKTECLVVIMDIDTISIDNRIIRDLTLKYPGIYLLCLSSERFHPHLKESICNHIHACINKPIDPEEILYWLKCIEKNHTESRNVQG